MKKEKNRAYVLKRIGIILLCFLMAIASRVSAAVWLVTVGDGVVPVVLRIISWSGYVIAIVIMVMVAVEKLKNSQKA